MLDVMGAGPLIGPWLGVWDRALDSPDVGLALAAVLFTMATTGIGLAIVGGARQRKPVQTVPAVHVPRPRRRVRRRR